MSDVSIGDTVSMVDGTMFTTGLLKGEIYGYSKIHVGGKGLELFNAVYIKDVRDPVLASNVVKT